MAPWFTLMSFQTSQMPVSNILPLHSCEFSGLHVLLPVLNARHGIQHYMRHTKYRHGYVLTCDVCQRVLAPSPKCLCFLFNFLFFILDFILEL